MRPHNIRHLGNPSLARFSETMPRTRRNRMCLCALACRQCVCEQCGYVYVCTTKCCFFLFSFAATQQSGIAVRRTGFTYYIRVVWFACWRPCLVLVLATGMEHFGLALHKHPSGVGVCVCVCIRYERIAKWISASVVWPLSLSHACSPVNFDHST